MLAVTAVGQPSAQRTMAYAVPLDAPPRRLPFGQVNDLALTATATVAADRAARRPVVVEALPGRHRRPPWVVERRNDPLFTRVLSDLNGQFAAPMLVGGRIVFLLTTRALATSTTVTLDGGDLRRHTDHDGFYARNPATDGSSVVYHAAATSGAHRLAAGAQPRKLDIQLTAPPAARAPRVITAADHLGELDCDETGQASVVEVRGTMHWLTHADGPARALSVNPAARARLPRVLGTTGKVAWITDAGGGDSIQIGEIEAESAATAATLTSVDLGNVTRLVASPEARGSPPRPTTAGCCSRRRVRRGHRAGGER